MPMRSLGVPGSKSSCLSDMRLRTVRVLSMESICYFLARNINTCEAITEGLN